MRLGIAFYIWLGVFNLMVPAQLWALANDVYTKERGKRLSPLIGIGSSLGVWLGAAGRGPLPSLGPYPLMLVAAAGLFVCLGAHRLGAIGGNGTAAPAFRHRGRPLKRPIGGAGGFQLVLDQRYLLYIGLLTVVLNIVNSLGEFVLGSIVEAEARRAVQSDAAGGMTTAVGSAASMGRFSGTMNLVGFLIQTFLVSRIIKYLGVAASTVHPAARRPGELTQLVFFPVLAIVRVAKLLENSTDYSIQNTVRHALFLPTSREAKYKAKQAIDGFFWRAGDLLQAVVVFVGTALAFQTRHYGLLNLAFVGVWLIIVGAIVREHKKLIRAPIVGLQSLEMPSAQDGATSVRLHGPG